jgi:hypothetical protein
VGDVGSVPTNELKMSGSFYEWSAVRLLVRLLVWPLMQVARAGLWASVRLTRGSAWLYRRSGGKTEAN